MFDPAELPYAAEDIATLSIILDARRAPEALTDEPPRVRFHIHESRVYEVDFTPAELDDFAPGWREALDRPADHGAPGRTDLEDAISESMSDPEEIASRAVLRIEVVPLDRTPTQIQIVRTVVEDVTVEADQLDEDAPGWRSALGADEPEAHMNTWTARNIAQLADDAHTEAEGDGQSPSAVLSVEIRSITQ